MKTSRVGPEGQLVPEPQVSGPSISMALAQQQGSCNLF